MAKIEGRLQTMAVDNGGGFVNINGIVDGSFTLEVEELDSTTHDSGAFRSFLGGRGMATVELTLRYDEADPGQLSLATAAIGQLDTYGWRFRQQVGGGFKQWTSTSGMVTSYNPSGPNDDLAELSVSIRMSGTITDTTQ
jgi:hypothetical protein